MTLQNLGVIRGKMTSMSDENKKKAGLPDKKVMGLFLF
jgi:hypothetical protein